MRTSRTWRTVLAVSTLVASQPLSAYAQAPPPATAATLRADIEQLKTDFATRLAELERRLAALEGTAPPMASAPAQAAPPSDGSASPMPNYGGLASASKARVGTETSPAVTPVRLCFMRYSPDWVGSTSTRRL